MALFQCLFTNTIRNSFNLQHYLGFLVAVVSVFGDTFVDKSAKPIYKAAFDNATHALIGGLSWSIVCLGHRNRNAVNALLEIAFCTILSSLIDLDHFIAARSFSLKDATNLLSRPILHCSSIPVVLTLYLIILAYWFNNYLLQKIALIIFTAFATHHTRDATRRGYWIYPFGHTPSIPYLLYIVINLLIPYSVSLIIKLMKLDGYYMYNTIHI